MSRRSLTSRIARAALLVVVGGAGCGSSGHLASGSDAAADVAADVAGQSCPRSASGFCSSIGSTCDPTWTEVLADHTFCGDTGIFDRRYTCGAYYLRELTNVDVVESLYYDMTTGALVSAWWYSANFGGTTCEAGPSDAARPDCTKTLLDSTCPDAGTAASGGR